MPRILSFVFFSSVLMASKSTTQVSAVQSVIALSGDTLPETAPSIVATSVLRGLSPTRSTAMLISPMSKGNNRPEKSTRLRAKTSAKRTKEIQRPRPTAPPSYLSIYTEHNGDVLGCTALATLSSAFLSYTAGQVQVSLALILNCCISFAGAGSLGAVSGASRGRK
jgi:hypothetical protein